MTNDEALAQEQEPVALQDDEIYDAAFSAYCRGENSRELFRIMWCNRLTCSIGWDRDELKSFARNIAALYTTPPPRPWVGSGDLEDSNAYLTPPQPAQQEPLTNGEIYTAYITATNQTLRPQDERLALAFARAIEAAHGIKENT